MANPIPYGRQHITQNDIDSVVEVLQSDYLTTGPKVKEFEEKFAKYVGSKYAVAVSNGTAALHLCAITLGVNSKSKVITSPITFAASANCIKYCGGEIDFVDIDPQTLVLDINEVRRKLEGSPKGTYSGIIPVDFAGHPVNMEEFRKLADEYDMWLLEDACHAPGGFFVDSMGEKHFCGNGRYADLAIFSFHPVKHIACGEGGMVTTDNFTYYKKLLQLRSHGMVYQNDERLIENHGKWYMELQELGYNYRMPDILCALGVSQLDNAQQGVEKRREIAKTYDKAFADTNIKTHIPSKGIGHAFHLYVIETENRKVIYDKLRDKNIFAQIHYIPLHLMPYYKTFGFGKGDFPIAEAYYERCLSLPMYPGLSKKEQQYVIDSVLNVI